MQPRPLNHLNAAAKLYPNAWKQIETFRSSKGRDLPDWPNWCFLPFAAWYAIVSEGGNMPAHLLPDVSRLAALGTWRYSQGVYTFNEHALAAIAETIPSGDMPCDVLHRLPEWCLYIETPQKKWLGDTLHGFFASLEFDINKKTPELRLLLDTETALTPLPIHMGPWTITEGIDRAIQQSQDFGAPNIGDITTPIAADVYGLISLLLYICSDEPEIDNDKEPNATPQRPRPKKTKRGWQLFPAKKPRIWKVGEKIGENLAKEHTNEGGAKSPHLRRAHWHGFWSGPREGERRYHYKYLPPTFVRGSKKQAQESTNKG
ncbi:AcrVA2 family anti-CRISPR protein [Teredinibacter purpureus]|uniref:AcrVA2 family anti-CRISPR protein n=1 Tax=Teredinibacter purpureus TaxID=2731756 RepID=UPI0005F7B47D|nr:hypothetical protein [Teredinibacter purpureus]